MDPKDYEMNPAEDIDLDEQEVHTVTGRRVTSGVAAAMAAEAELIASARAANLVPGGKSLSGDGTHSPIVQTRLPVSTRARFQAIAERRGVRTSKLLREAIDQFIEREESQAR
jgi:hypothetical protein